MNKTILTVASPVFEKMFDGEFKEKGAKEVKLKENPEEFLLFLKCLYPSVREPVTGIPFPVDRRGVVLQYRISVSGVIST